MNLANPPALAKSLSLDLWKVVVIQPQSFVLTIVSSLFRWIVSFSSHFSSEPRHFSTDVKKIYPKDQFREERQEDVYQSVKSALCPGLGRDIRESNLL